MILIAVLSGLLAFAIYLFGASFVLYSESGLDSERVSPAEMLVWWENKLKNGEDSLFVLKTWTIASFWPVVLPLTIIYCFLLWPIQKIITVWSLIFVAVGKTAVASVKVKMKPLADKSASGGELSLAKVRDEELKRTIKVVQVERG